jgi:hypothetical protein
VSSDYDYNIINDQVLFHRQDFGRAISLSKRTLVVGAPYADYDKLGYDKEGYNLIYKDWNSEGSSSKATGRGKVYVFHSSPAAQKVILLSSQVYHECCRHFVFLLNVIY